MENWTLRDLGTTLEGYSLAVEEVLSREIGGGEVLGEDWTEREAMTRAKEVEQTWVPRWVILIGLKLAFDGQYYYYPRVSYLTVAEQRRPSSVSVRSKRALAFSNSRGLRNLRLLCPTRIQDILYQIYKHMTLPLTPIM